MEQKKQMKISLNKVIIISVIIIILVSIITIGTYMILTRDNDIKKTYENIIKNDEKENEEVTQVSQSNYEKVNINGKIYYQRISDKTWDGEYKQDKYYTSEYKTIQKVVSYNEYLKLIREVNDISDKEIQKYYTDQKSNYIVLSYANGNSWCEIELIDCIEEKEEIIIYGDENVWGSMASGSGYFIAIPTKMPEGTKIEYRDCKSTSEINNLKNKGKSNIETLKDIIIEPMISYKPIIYLYPTEDMEVDIKLTKSELITCIYPKYDYENGWNVLAKPNGDLKDINTNRNLYALYYESKTAYDFKIEKEGFIVKGNDVATFLEEKLEVLGLNEREAEEFIIYWLPILQENKYNYIRFATMDEINANMPLEFSKEPDTLIRVLMAYKGLDKPIEVEEQELNTPERKGFVAVEWGGTQIK